MEQWSEIRRRVLVEGVSKRQIMRESGLHYKTLEKILSHSAPPGYRQGRQRSEPKLGPWRERIEQILTQDLQVPRKQRHSAKRIFERIKAEGYSGGQTQVKLAVCQARLKLREVFVPLSHTPGEAQADFGEALACIQGRLRKIHYFVLALPYSGVMFATAFECEKTESWWEGHKRAFEFLGGVPRRILYDNSRVLVAQILGSRQRRLTQGFRELVSHYLFEPAFCRVRQSQEKGVVEMDVGYVRRNWMVPVPQVASMEELNARLLACCHADLERCQAGKTVTKAVLLAEEKGRLLKLPAAAFEGSRKTSTTVSSMSLVRFDGNDYSVPVAYAHQPVVVKATIDRVEIHTRQQMVASHKRLWTSHGCSMDPMHYLALLERKPGALDHAKALRDWHLPPCFASLRRRLEERHGAGGTRDYIRVLRLLEKYPLKRVEQAVARSLSLGAVAAEVVAQFAAEEEPWKPEALSLVGREHLRSVQVNTSRAADYGCLLGGRGGEQ